MSGTLSVLANLRVAGALVLDNDVAELPETAKLGTLCVHNMVMYVYLDFNGLRTWYPLVRNLANTYVHTQAVPSLAWTVNTGFGSNQYWFQVKDNDGNYHYPSSVVDAPDGNSFVLNFSEAVTGTVIAVATNEMDVGTISTSLIKIGNRVILDSDGITIDGKRVLTENPDPVPTDWALIENKPTTIAGYGLTDAASIGGSTTQDFSSKNMSVSGVLAVNGEAFVVDSQNVTTADSVITLNKGEVGSGVTSGFSGIEVDRGLSSKYQILFNEAIDMFQVGMVGNLETLASQPYVDNAIMLAGDRVSTKTFTGAVTCNYSTEGSYVAATVTGPTTLSITGLPDATKAYGMTFELTNAGANVTWPASVQWLGSAPTLRASGVSMVTLVTRNGGTTWFGSAA